MYKIIKVLLTSGILLNIQPVAAIPSPSKIAQTEISPTPNQMMEFAASWGFELTPCQGNVAIIRHDLTGEKACIVPNSQIGVGKFVYDSANNKIRPENVQETSSSLETIEKKEYANTSIGSGRENRSFPSVNPQPQTKDPRINQVVFNFNNVYDYSTCLDVILLAYEDRQLELQNTPKNECANNILNLLGNNLSRDLTLQLIISADVYATETLVNRLYPPFGLRRRVAINLGYVYDIDTNNDDILKYVSDNNQ